MPASRLHAGRPRPHGGAGITAAPVRNAGGTGVTGATAAPRPRGVRPRTLRVATACGVAALAGAGAGLVLPRGPATTLQSVAAVLVCTALGVATAWVAASRGLIWLGPVALGLGFEAARAPVSGPTIDGVHLDSVYGVMALVVGRGFDVLLMGFPMAVGAAWGAAWARRRPAQARPARPARPARRSLFRLLRQALAVGATALLVALLAALARPAGTEPVLRADGTAAADGIAELVAVDIGGHEQSIMLRGADRSAPVLLFLEGGPGGSAVGAMRASGGGLEQDFVVAVWDQRGTGKSVAALEPTATLTLEQMVQDTLAVADYLRGRFAKDTVYLVGSSWGSTLGVLAAQRAPAKFAAFVGAGQMVDQQETDKRMYAESLAWAERTGRADFAQRLRDNGPPPYTDMLKYPDALSTNAEYHDYARGADYNPAGAYPASFFVPEYTLTEQVRGMGALLETFAVLYPQLQDTDFRRDVPELAVPVFVVEGAHESPGRAELVRDWYGALRAPSKQLVVFDRSGHTPHLDEPGRFHRFMVDTVLARTGGSR